MENVSFPLLIGGVEKKDAQQKALEILQEVLLEEKAELRPGKLSGGEQQRVAIARALVNEPSVILADEPTGNLDSKTGQKIMELVQNLYEEGHTVILVTHEKYTAEHAERILRLRDGMVREDVSNHARRNARDGELIK